MKKTYKYLLFGIMIIAQIAVSAQMVYTYERAIAENNVYKFKTAPIDPNDPFRGKYVLLNFDINSFETKDSDWENGQKAYAYFSKDYSGFAKLETLTQKPLQHTSWDYVQVIVSGYYSGKIHFRLPFDRYFMEESKAYDAEVLARNVLRNGKINSMYALVSLHKGTFVLTDVIINDISLKKAVQRLE